MRGPCFLRGRPSVKRLLGFAAVTCPDGARSGMTVRHRSPYNLFILWIFSRGFSKFLSSHRLLP